MQAVAIASARSVIAGEALAGKIPLAAILEIHDKEGRRVLDLPFRDAVILDG
jgi:hypothetical protein